MPRAEESICVGATLVHCLEPSVVLAYRHTEIMSDMAGAWIVVDSNGLFLTGCYFTHRFLFRESEGECWDPYDEESVAPEGCYHEWWDRDEAKVFTSLVEAHRIAGLATETGRSGAMWRPQSTTQAGTR